MQAIDLRRCTRCGKEKPITEYYRHNRDGYRYHCKPCNSAAGKHYKRQWYRKNARKERAAKLERSYGITIEEYEQRREQQDRSCAICGRAESEISGKLQVDHDHAFGTVRALLCSNCNQLLGHAQEDTGILKAAATYLENYDESS